MSNTKMQTQTSNALHNVIMEAGGKDRPPMLAPVAEGSSETTTEGYMENYKNVSQDIQDQLNVEAVAVRAEKTAMYCQSLALVAQQQPVYHPNHHTQYSSTRSQQATRNRGKAIVNSSSPIYDQEPATVTEDDEMSKEKEIDKLMALISLCTPVVQKSEIQCYNCKEYGYVSRECQKPKREKDAAYHKENMLLCKQEEARVQLNADQADWKDDTDDESGDQELEAHYMYMAQIQEVTLDVADIFGPIFDTEPLHKRHDEQDDNDELIKKHLRKFQAELDKYHDVNYASKVAIDCAKAKGDLIWWYPKFTPPGYKWKPRSTTGNVNPNVSMPLGNASRTANTLDPMTPRENDLFTDLVAHICIHYSSKKHPFLIQFDLMAKAHASQAWLCYRRLSHLNFDAINLLSKNNIITGLPKLKSSKDHICSSFLIDFLTLVQRGLHAQVRTVRTDKGTKFLNKTLHAYFAKEGIRHETSTAQTPEQNGVVERRNRTLVEAARTMLSAAKVPLFFWAEAIATTCFTQNRSLVNSLQRKTFTTSSTVELTVVKFFHISALLATSSEMVKILIKEGKGVAVFLWDHVSFDPGPQCPTMGYAQKEGIDFEESFALVARLELSDNSLRMLHISHLLYTRWTLKHHFFTVLKGRSVVNQPDGFVDPYHPDKVYHLKKALYGLKQAPRAWYDELSKFLVSKGFSKGSIDLTLFITKHGEDILLVQIYIDDIIFGSTNPKLS
ncbi:retrovirus-related pol polyprotein from transposon TNT 1-94 [Tanacetum coccineum]